MSSKVKTCLALILGLGLVALPWLLGGNLPPVRTIAIGVTGLLLLGVVCCPSTIGSPTRIGLMMKWVLMAGVGYTALQLIPSLTGTHSDYPSATRARLCEVILGVGVFVAASSLFTKRRSLPYLFGLIAFNGVLLTFAGIAHSVSSSEKVLGVYELIQGGEPFGPFVNANNAGGYLLMCFAAALFFLAKRVFQSSTPTPTSGLGSSTRKKTGAIRGTVEAIGREFATLETKHLYAYAAIALIGAGVFSTLSRGASVAFLIAAVSVWVFLFRKSWASVGITALVVACGVGFLAWSEQNEAITTNLETLTDLGSASEQRLQHWGDAWQALQPNMVFGSGLGTYAFTYPKFQTGHFNRWFKHAENQYLETLTELGIVGLIILLLAITLTIVASLKLLSKPDSNTRAVGAVGLFAVISQVVAGALDFGLYQPANTVLMATLVGVVFAQHNRFWSAQNLTRNESSKFRSLVGWLMAVTLLVGCVWATYEYSAVDARRSARRFTERFDPARDDDRIDDYQKVLEYALKIRPDDSEAHYQMALNRILKYRMVAVEGMMAPIEASEFASYSLTPEQIEQQMELDRQAQPKTIVEAWDRTPLNALHRYSRMRYRVDPAYLKEISDFQPVQDYLRVAWEHLLEAEEHSDRLWLTQLRLAQLSCVMGQPGQEAEHRQLALQRCPNNSKSLYTVGLLEHHSGQQSSACEHWHKCLVFSSEFERPIIQLCRYELGMKPFLEEVLPADPYYRLKIAKRYFGAPEDLLIKQVVLGRTKAALMVEALIEFWWLKEPSNLSKSEYNYLIGQIELDSQNYSIASVHFRKALELDNDNADWRVQYARSLIGEANYSEAIVQLKKCQLYKGDHQVLASKLLLQASRRRELQRKM